MRFALSIVLVVACCPLVAQTPSPSKIQRLDGSTIPFAEADAFARKTLAAAHVTGAEIAILNDGHLVWSAAYGNRRLKPDSPMDRETTTWAASITKSVFATYLMQLVEKHQFDLDAPIASQLEKPLNTYEPYREKASAIVLDPLWPTVTPRMLLAHTSGLANFATMEKDGKMHLRFKPGTQFLYSGEGINLVQFVIEQKLHRPLDELMQEAILAPLGMTRTSLTYRPEFAANVADRFDRDGKFLSETRRAAARGAGSMTTSADDLARFLTALFTDKILQPQTRDAMLHPFFNIRTEHQFGFTGHEGQGKEAKVVGLAYGVGWGLLTTTPFGPAFFKEGHGDGAQNYVICFNRSRSCMILLTNSDNGELAFRPLLEKILGDTVTPWEWEGYTPAYIEKSRRHP